MTFDEFVNRDRLFPVEPGFADMIDWEMHSWVDNMRRDFNWTPLDGERVWLTGQYGAYYGSLDQLTLFTLPWWEIKQGCDCADD